MKNSSGRRKKGRTYRDKIANDPSFCDFALVTGIDMDSSDFEEILPLLESAKKNGQWVVLGGHEIGESGFQTTRIAMPRKLMEYALEPGARRVGRAHRYRCKIYKRYTQEK